MMNSHMLERVIDYGSSIETKIKTQRRKEVVNGIKKHSGSDKY